MSYNPGQRIPRRRRRLGRIDPMQPESGLAPAPKRRWTRGRILGMVVYFVWSGLVTTALAYIVSGWLPQGPGRLWIVTGLVILVGGALGWWADRLIALVQRDFETIRLVWRARRRQ
ncbi:MAG TPA: hypothetical protein VLF67_01375 [Candidatus Saccharimonas sp.]|nr:hypothetical protein [Candidatus Saccharimonas sp.]